MTRLQQKTIDEMMRQGLHTQCYAAEHCWQKKSPFHLEMAINVTGQLKELIQKSNCEIERR